MTPTSAILRSETEPATGGHPPPPQHVAIIMDGNGRWASRRGLPRFEGHRRGVEAVRRTVKASIEIGIRYLTIYSFSTENWSRPAAEIAELMGLLRRFIRNDLADLHAQNVRVRIIGERTRISEDLQRLLDEAESVTRNNSGLTLVIAFNYGSRQEMALAMQRLAKDAASGQIDPQAISPDTIGHYLMTDGMPEPDLLIRTSGEQRLSNFLLWQLAYAEFVFLPVLWPDFAKSDLEEALQHFQGRNRRFGGIGSEP
jgi:undecaprenyl diphosphate synthase